MPGVQMPGVQVFLYLPLIFEGVHCDEIVPMDDDERVVDQGTIIQADTQAGEDSSQVEDAPIAAAPPMC